MRKPVVRTLVPVAVAAILTGIAGPAQAATVIVDAVDNQFIPMTATANLGDTVTWTFDPLNNVNHTTTDNTGMGLWDSGPLPAGATFSFQFTAAGTYSYHCTIHPGSMKGKIQVPIKASPQHGIITTQFTVTWASVTAPVGFVYDVQIQRPAGGGFVNWGTRGLAVPEAEETRLSRFPSLQVCRLEPSAP
jgi:plastocyanin